MLTVWPKVREALVGWSMDHPRVVLTLTLLLTLAFGSQLPRIQTDTDPKSMLPATSPVRQYNAQMEAWFGLHPDVIVVGVWSEGGIFTPETLARIARLTDGILRLPGVIARDVVALPTVTDVTVADGVLQARPILERVPPDAAAADRLRQQVLANPLLVNRLISADAKTTAIYVPIETSANGFKVIADRIKTMAAAEQGPERYFLAGDPVARYTEGAEMFRQKHFFAPLAGLVMSVVLYLLFKSWWLVVANIAVAVIAIIWSMGLFSGLGIPIHILASMSPIFLIAISTDTVHIFNEFTFRRREVSDRRAAIRETMKAVGTPVLFSDLTTIAGFASLAIGPIIPARVLGLLVAFGTLVILLLSFTLVPALLALARDHRPSAVARVDEPASSWLARIGQGCVAWKTTVVLVGVVLVAVSAVGLSKIRINNNLVAFFKPESEIRVAEQHLSQALGGTAPLYLVADGKTPDAVTRPEFLRALEDLQRKLEQEPVVGKTLSVADVVKRISRVLNNDDPSREVIPDSPEAVAQYLLLFSSMARPQEVNIVVDYPYQKANLIVQLRSWDAVETRALLERIRTYLASRPLPGGVELKPAGMAYFNMVWSDEVLVGMLEGFIASCVLVLFLLILNYRSFRWGVVSFLPLLFTVVLIYGAVGFIGKDFDLPISVLSTLTLGLAVDFAIHFVSRFQQRYRETRDLEGALIWTAARPGRGIVRNAVLFALGFAPMLFANLTPYITVGASMIAIMLLSALATVVYLPALIALFPRWLTRGL
ncbi:MAG TPA: MMPL family transporter [Methylomirabilota bacterium]|nr:MMPL family transporter [Methylomirabilota bacterium]